MRYVMAVSTLLCVHAALAQDALPMPAPASAPVSTPASAPAPAPSASVPGDALRHALRVERRAAATSFAALDAFGQAAARRTDAEGLARLAHVTRIIINQGDFGAAERWNGLLQRNASVQRDARFLAVAHINALQIRSLRDHDVDTAQFEALATAQTDWLARAVARTALARRLYDDARAGDALRLMAATLQDIPERLAGQAGVAAAAWDTVAIGHVMVDDVPGFLKAIGRAETLMAASSYPRPDYESVYNLTQSVSYLGRHQEARELAVIYARLAARDGTATTRAYAGNICAFAAASREDWRAVLDCLAPYGADLDAPEVVRRSMLPFRATAYARTGRVALARRDVERIRALVASGGMRMNSGARRAEAELLIASGDTARGVPALRDYHLRRFERASQSAAAAMEQVVRNIDDELQAANERNRLQDQVIGSQRLLAAALVALGAVLLVLVLVLVRQRARYRRQAITDTLTGLPNRRYSEQRATEIIAQATTRAGRAVLVMFDLDHFKSCNDRFGHDAGDDALKTFARLVRASIRPGDVFGRWGGEEFLLVLPNAGLDEARPLLERIAARCAEATVALAPEYPLRFSGGAVDIPGTAQTLDAALLACDALLYGAKAAGRARVHYAGVQSAPAAR